MKLNPKQQRFCEEYLIDNNSAQAAIRAGYSKKTARTIGSKLLTKIDIQEYIARLQVKIQDRTDITIQSVVKFIEEVSKEARDDGDNNNALKGADMLMKHLGGYNADKPDEKGAKVIIVESF